MGRHLVVRRNVHFADHDRVEMGVCVTRVGRRINAIVRKVLVGKIAVKVRFLITPNVIYVVINFILLLLLVCLFYFIKHLTKAIF